MKAGIALLLLAASSTLTVAAQDRARPSAPPVLEAVHALKCTFTAGTLRTGGGAEPRVRQAAKTELVTIQLIDIDADGGTATLKRGARSISSSVRADRSNLYFLSVDPDGTALITTVFAQEVRPGWLKAAHSQPQGAERNVVLTVPSHASHPLSGTAPPRWCA
jgi:hypothetical protein